MERKGGRGGERERDKIEGERGEGERTCRDVPRQKGLE